jgi:hypothetical protein
MDPISTAQAPTESVEYRFRLRNQSSVNVTWQYVGAAGLIVLAIVGFISSLTIRVNAFTVQFMTTMPILAAIQVYAAAKARANAAQEVGVGDYGVRVTAANKTATYDWETIAWSTVQKNGWTQRKEMTLFDANGKALTKLDESLENFEFLQQIITEAISRKEDPATARVRGKKAIRNGVICLVAGAILSAAVVGMVIATRHEQQSARILATSGVPGMASIERRFLAPNGITPRLEYRVVTPEGKSGTRNAEMSRVSWDGLEGQKTVPVIYVPSDPDNSRLAFGEVKRRELTDSPVVTYALAAMMGAFCLLLIAVGVLALMGWDVDIDDVTKKVSLKRIGAPS